MFKPVLKSEEAQAAILVYEPQSFQIPVPEQAKSFARNQDVSQGNFVISDLVAEKTKLHDLERRNFEIKVETEVLNRLKSVEEKAYAQAHELGLKQGQDRGFEEMKASIVAQLELFKTITDSIGHIKKNLLIENEKHLVATLFHIAKSIALKEIASAPETVLTVINQALESAQSEEQVVLKLNPIDAAFIEKVKTEGAPGLDKAQFIKIEAVGTMTRGGAIVETNYGVIDATIETRLRKIWEALESAMPKKTHDDLKKTSEDAT